ncbi:membrane protein insertion efficiency factor YidD [Luteimonas sp. FXH3W]|uniref:Putative membrane protein insertion efficiency factor n=1 Tax=Aquilutibacter rugosus TaxID=3115820 RepID=A0ABU7V0F0_9GAMM
MLSNLLLSLLRLYKRILSPLLGPRCRFYPSCSDYMSQAIHLHGPATGLCLGVRRLLRCHPFHPGGVDPVPEAPSTCCHHQRTRP